MTIQTIKVTEITKTLTENTSATGFAIVGTVVDSEGNTVHVSESGGSEVRMGNEAAYYMNSKNGFKKQDLTLQLYGVRGLAAEFKIIK